MNMKEGDVVAAALALPAASRVVIIKKLTDSLLDEVSLMEQAWFREAEDRVLAFERGEIDAVPGDQLIRDLRGRHDR